MTTSNYLVNIGNFPNGQPTYVVIGTTVTEGEDMDARSRFCRDGS